MKCLLVEVMTGVVEGRLMAVVVVVMLLVDRVVVGV